MPVIARRIHDLATNRLTACGPFLKYQKVLKGLAVRCCACIGEPKQEYKMPPQLRLHPSQLADLRKSATPPQMCCDPSPNISRS